MSSRTTFYLIFIASISSGIECSDKHEKIGPFKAITNSLKVCAGPKVKICAACELKLINNNIIDANVQVHQKCTLTKVKVYVRLNGMGVPGLELTRPCKHLFLRAMFGSVLNSTDNCQVDKGSFTGTVNVSQVMQSFTSGVVFYGNYTFKAHVFSDHCIFACIVLQISVIPKK